MNKRIVVIGAGIVGASLAYHLAGKGAEVTVLDAGDVACGVTGRSFAWINTSHSATDPIAALRGAAIEQYRRLESELPGLAIRWSGALTYGVQAPSPSATLVSRERIRELEPNLRHPPLQASHAPDEGALDAVKATHALLAGARAKGATVLTHTQVVALATHGTRVTGVQTAAGIIETDMVVLAAGTGTAALTEAIGLPLPILASPAIFIRYAAPSGLVRSILSSPDMEVRQADDGTLLAAEDYLDDAPQNQPAALALRTAKVIRNELDGVTSLQTQQACIGLRPMPADGIPIIGPLPSVAGVYVCTMHPGVVLAAVVGQLASEEIMQGKTSPALAPCRPERFFKDDAPSHHAFTARLD